MRLARKAAAAARVSIFKGNAVTDTVSLCEIAGSATSARTLCGSSDPVSITVRMAFASPAQGVARCDRSEPGLGVFRGRLTFTGSPWNGLSRAPHMLQSAWLYFYRQDSRLASEKVLHR